MNSFSVRRLRTKSIFKIVFVGSLFSFVPLFSLLGILASLDRAYMYLGGTQIKGISAIAAGPFLGLIFAVIVGIIISVFASLGLMLYGKLRPLTLEYYDVKSTEK